MSLHINHIYNMDCMKGMEYIEDRTIDMILCDLPQDITKNKWDVILPLRVLIQTAVLSRLKKNQICAGWLKTV